MAKDSLHSSRSCCSTISKVGMSPEANDVYPDIPHRRNPPYIPGGAPQRRPPRVAARCPSPAAFLLSNLHLTSASLARCDPAARPAGADRADRPGPEARWRRHVKVAEVWTFGFTGGEVGVVGAGMGRKPTFVSK